MIRFAQAIFAGVWCLSLLALLASIMFQPIAAAFSLAVCLGSLAMLVICEIGLDLRRLVERVDGPTRRIEAPAEYL